MVLIGAQVKSIVCGNISIKESHVRIIKDELFLIGATVTPSDNLVFSYYSKFEKNTSIKLLASKKQIKKLQKAIQEKGSTLVLSQIYVGNTGKIKALLHVGIGKQLHDKRNVIKERDLKRVSKSEY